MERFAKLPTRIKAIWGLRSVRCFVYAILFRIVCYALYVPIMAIFGEYQGLTFENFLEAWSRGDSSHYLAIAQNGYSGMVENGEHLLLVFLPLYPWLIRVVSIFTHNFKLAGIIISTVCFGIGNVYLDKIVCLDYGQASSARTRLLLAIYPFSFFFGSIHTESLFFSVSTAFFYFLRKHKWGKVAIAGCLACLTKIQGILLAFSVVAELMYSFHGLTLLRKRSWKMFFQNIILNGLKCMPMVGGFLIYLYINYKVEGDFFRFMYYQRTHWANGLCPIWHTFGYLINNAFDFVNWDLPFIATTWIPEFILFFVYIIAILYGFIKKQQITYQIYLILFFLLTYSSTWLISGARYSLSAIPLFLFGGSFLTNHKRICGPVYLLFIMLMVMYMIAFCQGKPTY